MKKSFLIAAVLMVAGCSGWPENIAELQQQGLKESFTVNQSYQQAYKNLKSGFDQCWKQPNLWQLGSTVDAQLYPDLGEGQFIIKLVTQFGQPKPIIMIIINRVNEQQSSVSVIYLESFDKNSIPVYRRWANGDLSCE